MNYLWTFGQVLIQTKKSKRIMYGSDQMAWEDAISLSKLNRLVIKIESTAANIALPKCRRQYTSFNFWNFMQNVTKLILIKSIHTMIWLLFNVVFSIWLMRLS
jgi:hypothetical protein